MLGVGKHTLKIKVLMKFFMEENFMKMKNKPIILDSNVLIAYFNEHDSLHERAVLLVKKIEAQQKVLSDLILAEVGTVLLTKTKQIQLIGRLLRHFVDKQTKNTALVFCTHPLFSQTLDIFSKQTSSWLSMEDCSIIAYARHFKTTRIATFDKGLKKMFVREFEFLG
ncbi:MAG TPA: hypothetical protein DCX25_04585 [Candidatus Pacebacteria bacterium]|nr:hypothetical protein [Candidatus Paceibacterota bacterium]HCR10903.1 hypothetical protein [Candidatus Paceibacterota bacterium]HCR92837.1 hypothetical protein [Candidatus Paceibacterota bacterium]